MFKVNNKDTRMTSITSLWCLYCSNFTPSSVSTVDFKQVNVTWESSLHVLEAATERCYRKFVFRKF